MKGAPSHLAILNKLEDSLDFLDLASMTFAASIPLPSHPHELALSRDGRTLYASIYGDGVYGNNVNPGHQVFAIDVASMAIRQVIDVAPHRGPHAMAEAPDGRLWVTCDDSSEVIAVDPGSAAVAHAIGMGGHGGHFMVLSADGRTAYVSNKDTAHLSVVDASAHAVRATVPLAEGCEGLCLSPDGSRLYVMSHMGSPLPNPGRPRELSFYVVDTASLRVVQQVPLPTLPAIALDADRESRISATPDGLYLLVTAFRWNSVVVLDAATLAIRHTILVDAEPMNVAYRSDEPGIAYIANHGAGIMSRLDVAAGRVTDRILSTPAGRPGRPEHLAFVQRHVR
jgi:YVTN family beta-propeller protein